MSNKKNNNLSSYSPFIIWRNYAIGAFAVSLVPVLIMVLPAGWCQFATLIISLILFSFVRYNRKSKSETCSFIPYAVARSLIILTVIFVVTDYFNAGNLEVIKPLKALSVLTMTLIVLAIMHGRGIKNVLCVDCLLRNGSLCERYALGHIYRKEYKYLIPRQIKVYIAVIAVGCIYIFGFYHPEYPDPLDDFFFYIFPLVVTFFDLALLRIRYLMVGIYNKMEKSDTQDEVADGKKRLRITLVCGDKVYYIKKDGLFETPFVVDIDFDENVSAGMANAYISENLGFVGADAVRFCYGSLDYTQRRSVEHYFCFVSDADIVAGFEEKYSVTGQWFAKEELEADYNNGIFSPFVKAELSRTYRVMITSKLYDINGKRKINIKGYIPNFSIADFKDTSVDFSDNRWVYLSQYNMEARLARVRLIWYKYIEGLG